MQLSRTTALVALIVIALAAPVAAFALEDSSDGQGTTHRSSHATKAKQHKSHEAEHATGQERADEASAAGRAHAEAMKAWAACLAEAASGPKSGEHTGPAKDVCGEKPVSPGRMKHESGGPAPPFAPGKGKDHPRGDSGSHRQH